jgi:hypothetical protein
MRYLASFQWTTHKVFSSIIYDNRAYFMHDKQY